MFFFIHCIIFCFCKTFVNSDSFTSCLVFHLVVASTAADNLHFPTWCSSFLLFVVEWVLHWFLGPSCPFSEVGSVFLLVSFCWIQINRDALHIFPRLLHVWLFHVLQSDTAKLIHPKFKSSGFS